MCNRLLWLGRPLGAVTLSRLSAWCTWSTKRGINLSSTELPTPWSPYESSPSRKNPHGRTGNGTRDLMISSQKLWPLDHKAGQTKNVETFKTHNLRLTILLNSRAV
jgi:hypothetical protein